MEEKKKGNGGLIILVVLLLIACIGMGGFIFVNKDKLMATENTKTTVDNEKKDTNDSNCKEQKVYAVTDEKISNLIDQLTVGFSCDALERYTNDKKVTVDEISNDRAYEIALYNQGQEKSNSTITVDELTKMIQKYLGKDYKFDISKINQSKGKTCISHYYDSSSNTIVPQETACGGTCGPHTTYTIVKAIDTDGMLELDVKVLFVDKDFTGFYSNYAKTNKVSEVENSFLPFEKGDTYKFIFKNEDGNYVFVSSELVK